MLPPTRVDLPLPEQMCGPSWLTIGYPGAATVFAPGGFRLLALFDGYRARARPYLLEMQALIAATGWPPPAGTLPGSHRYYISLGIIHTE